MMNSYTSSIIRVFAELTETQHYGACHLQQASRDYRKTVNEHPNWRSA
jgi:hypothetical protein